MPPWDHNFTRGRCEALMSQSRSRAFSKRLELATSWLTDLAKVDQQPRRCQQRVCRPRLRGKEQRPADFFLCKQLKQQWLAGFGLCNQLKQQWPADFLLCRQLKQQQPADVFLCKQLKLNSWRFATILSRTAQSLRLCLPQHTGRTSHTMRRCILLLCPLHTENTKE